MSGKNFKIWGVSYGPVGDLIMGLPLLTYFEKKYPNSYKYYVIQKRSSICAPLYINHPLIDKIKVTDNWEGFGAEDNSIMEQCQIKTTSIGWKHSSKDWHNKVSCVEETAIIAGVNDIREVLTEEEMKPKLYRWFDVGIMNPECHTYSKVNIPNNNEFHNNIAIYPFALGGRNGRSPSIKWWSVLLDKLFKMGYTVYHYGRGNEPQISQNPCYKSFTYLSYFEQVQRSLASRLAIGTDSGSMWVMGAYSHPSIHLMTNWLVDHNSNLLGLAPVNDNATNLFEKGGCDNISIDKVVEVVKERVKL